MAIYHLAAKLISRKAGRSATAAAAYRAAERIHDERTGLTHDYTRKRGVEHRELMLPHGLDAGRSAFWNAVELKNKRANSRVAREFEIALPAELSAEQRQALARQFAGLLVERYGIAADVCLHAPHRDGDQRNFHAHILTSDNVVNADGSLGNKCRDLDGVARTMAGDSRNAIDELREEWGRMANEALERAGRTERVDHRNHALRMIDAEPTEHQGPKVTHIERKARERAESDGREYEPLTDRGAEHLAILNRNAEKLRDARERIASVRERLSFARQTWGRVRDRLLRVSDQLRGRSPAERDRALLESIRQRLSERGDILTVEQRAGVMASRQALDDLRREVCELPGSPPDRGEILRHLVAELEQRARVAEHAARNVAERLPALARPLSSELRQARSAAEQARSLAQRAAASAERGRFAEGVPEDLKGAANARLRQWSGGYERRRELEREIDRQSPGVALSVVRLKDDDQKIRQVFREEAGRDFDAGQRRERSTGRGR